MYEIEFEIPGLPPMPNQIMYRHWAVKRQNALHWKRQVAYAVVGRRPSRPLVQASVYLTRVSSREPDWDNLAASFKHVIDGLIVAKIIVDDSMKTIGQPSITWEKAARKSGFIRVKVIERCDTLPSTS